jgi:hypothetical protein
MANPPAQTTREPYRTWLSGFHEPSPYFDLVFDWYDEQLGMPLTSDVDRDPDKLFVRVDRALAQAIKLEDAGDALKGTTVGFEAYGRVDVPIALALETMLFFCGKPVGKQQGDTYPYDTIFSKVHCTIEEKWGAGNYFCSMAETNGGMIQDMHDDYAILVRGSATDGYTIFTSFIGPTVNRDTQNPEDTQTAAVFMIAMLRSVSDNSCEFRQSMRRNGQSYTVLGLDFGRKTYGFNVERFRKAAKAATAAMRELRDTGKIKEKGP